ncbi:hypothetical protein [Bacterioplanoides sp.]|uniref:hypothetical protein n=1 Tax=Bacterioplanoides sp. TaxID=2066072 RepID=UPI003B00C3AE
MLTASLVNTRAFFQAKKKGLVKFPLLLICSLTVFSQAAEVTIPNQFSAGTAAVAVEVNANFSAVETAVDDNAVRVLQLESENTAQQTAIEELQTAIATLQAENAKLANFVDTVLPFMQGGIDEQNNPAVFFSGANVHINNGGGSTRTINGTGNLIVGYNEVGAAELLNSRGFCSIININDATPYLNQVDCENASGIWSITTGAQKIGSHNIVVGEGHSYTQYSGIVTGQNNVIAAPASTANAGERNLASGFLSSISGGNINTSNGEHSSVSGGSGNRASGIQSNVTGGRNNMASGDQSSISGGSENLASGVRSSVSGGTSNASSGTQSSISGGFNRSVSGLDDWRAGDLFEDN